MTQSPLHVDASRLAWQEVGKGVSRKILGYNPEIMMVSVNFKKGAVGSLHTHPHRQVTYVAAGSFDVSIGGEKRTLRAGDSFMIPSGVEHGVMALEEGVLIDVFAPAREDFLKQV